MSTIINLNKLHPQMNIIYIVTQTLDEKPISKNSFKSRSKDKKNKTLKKLESQSLTTFKLRREALECNNE